MRKIWLSAVAAAAVWCGAAAAQVGGRGDVDDFQYQGEIQYEILDGTQVFSEDGTRFQLAFSAALQPVDVSNYPIPEARYLDRSAWAGARVNWTDQDLAGGQSADGLGFGLTGRYASEDVPVAVTAMFDTAELENGGDTSFTDWELGIGYWVLPDTPRLEAGLFFGMDNTEFDAGTEVDVTSYGAFGKYLINMQGDRWINAETRINFQTIDIELSEDDDTNINFEILGDYYFTQLLGAGAGIQLNTGDNDAFEGFGWLIRVVGYYNTNIGGELAYSTFSPDADTSDDFSAFTLRLVGRF